MFRSLSRIVFLSAVSCAALAAAYQDQARACSLVGLTEHVVDANEEAVDTTPPKLPVLGDVMVHRRPAQNGCASSTSSCDGSGSIGIYIDAAMDDRTAEAEMGYVFELAGGELPDNMSLPPRPVRAELGGMWLHFSDRDQPIDFTLEVRTMDLGGNLSEPVLVRVSDGGDADGCSAGTRSGPVTMILVLLALVAALRRQNVLRAWPRNRDIAVAFPSGSGRRPARVNAAGA
jgi:uncharacterized protein (TIGR03382 family)